MMVTKTWENGPLGPAHVAGSLMLTVTMPGPVTGPVAGLLVIVVVAVPPPPQARIPAPATNRPIAKKRAHNLFVMVFIQAVRVALLPRFGRSLPNQTEKNHGPDPSTSKHFSAAKTPAKQKAG